jgi:hypothetical protein
MKSKDQRVVCPIQVQYLSVALDHPDSLKAIMIKHLLVSDNYEYAMKQNDFYLYGPCYRFNLNTFN